MFEHQDVLHRDGFCLFHHCHLSRLESVLVVKTRGSVLAGFESDLKRNMTLGGHHHVFDHPNAGQVRDLHGPDVRGAVCSGGLTRPQKSWLHGRT